MEPTTSLEQWCVELRGELASRGWEKAYPLNTAKEREVWRDYWEGGYSPLDAMREELSYA